MLTRTDRRRFPILIAAIAALALAMTLLFSPVQAQEGSVPDKPRGLSATATHDQVVLNWDDPSDDSITGYVILRRMRVNNTGGEFSELVADTGTAALTYTDDTVAASLTYTYRIKAINEHGTSERSRWVHIDTPAAPVPDKPRGLDATATHDSVTLTWDDPSDDSITGYVILRRMRVNNTGGEFSELVADTGTAALTYTDDTVAASLTYTYRIKAINEHGTSERSRWSHIDTPAAPEPTPAASQSRSGGTQQDRSNHEVNICDRTPEVEEWILAQLPSDTDCGAVTAQQLAAITDPPISALVVAEVTFSNIAALAIEGYSSDILLSSDFAGLTGITKVFIFHSPALMAVPAGAFDEFTKSGLTEVNLSHNGLKAIDVDAFDGLTALTNLDLRYNDITELPEGVFSGLTALTLLDLRGNSIAQLAAGIFSGLTALEEIVLSLNSLTTLPTGILTGLDLVELHLENNSISALPADLFQPLDDTFQFLWLHNNSLTALDEDIFDGLSGLLFLILSNNDLTALPANLFADLDDSLSLLALNGNEITSLDGDIFDGLDGVSNLYLHDNQISALPDDLFDPFDETLQQIWLRNNRLSALDEDIFDDLSGLVLLLLSGNSLTSLPEDVFDGLSSLGILTLNDNSLTTLETDLFDPLDDSLTNIHLHNNGLTALNVDIFDGLDGLTELDLRGNSLTTLETDLFDPLDNSLKQLYLQDNGLTALNVDIFDGLDGLEDLRLSENSIASLTAGVFEDLDDSLKTLDLRDIDGADDDLTTLPAMVFGGLTGLEYLDLSCNGLTALDLTRFDPFATTLLYLDISANAFTATTRPTEAAVTAKLTNADLTFDLDDTSDCLSAREAGLSSLTLSAGTLTPPFTAPGVTVQDYYFVDVDHTVEVLTILPTPKDADATVEPIGATVDADPNTAGLQIALAYGNNIVQWKVDSRDGANTANYHVEVFRAHPPASISLLSELVLSGVVLTPAFEGGTYTYTADVASTVTETTVTATPLDPDATAVIKLGGTEDSDGTVDLVVGTNAITVEVTAEDGTTMQTYTVTVTRPATPPDDPADPPEADFREGDGEDLPADTTTTGVVEVGGFGARGAIDAPVFVEYNNRPGYDFDTDWFAVELEAGRTYRIDMKGRILSSPGLNMPGVPVDPELTLSLPQINAIYDDGRGLPCQHVGGGRIKRPPPVPCDVSRPCRRHPLHRGERRVVRVGRLRASGHRYHGG